MKDDCLLMMKEQWLGYAVMPVWVWVFAAGNGANLVQPYGCRSPLLLLSLPERRYCCPENNRRCLCVYCTGDTDQSVRGDNEQHQHQRTPAPFVHRCRPYCTVHTHTQTHTVSHNHHHHHIRTHKVHLNHAACSSTK